MKTIKACKRITLEYKDFILSKQLIKSGTSIGANITEVQGGQSLKDFIYKLSISYKEAAESHYWIRLLRDSEMMDHKTATTMLQDCDELLKIIGSIIKTCRAKERNLK